MSAYHAMIRDQLEEGLREIHHTANQLMHEIAGEVWRTAGGDKGDVQGKHVEAISRDQTIRGLIAHTDERFQTLAVRTARLEDTLNMLAEGVRGARDQIAAGVVALEQAQSSPVVSGTSEIQQRLDEVTRQIALAFETLAGRDRAITESVQQRVREHGELVANETARITHAMESYVQQGVEAMGQLAGSVEKQVASIVGREDEVGARIAQAAESQLQMLDAKLRAITERSATDASTVNEAITYLLDTTDQRNRSLGEFLELMHDRVGMETRDVLMSLEGMEARNAERVRGAIDERMTRVEITAHDAAVRSAREVTKTLETRILGVAELVRSDSLALRNELVRSAAAQDEEIARALDERLGRVTQSLSSTTEWMAEEITRRIRDEAIGAIRSRLDEAITVIEQQGDTNARMLNGRLDDAVAAIDRNVIRMSDSLEGQLDRMGRTVGDRASETVIHSIDARIGGLAKMVRSDNESLARQILADQESSKQALRAMKELQASLPADVIETVQRRMDDLAESVAKSQEMLAQRIDRMAAKIGERHENDIQIVVDRMGDAMHALASLGRTPEAGTGNGDRIDLE